MLKMLFIYGLSAIFLILNIGTCTALTDDERVESWIKEISNNSTGKNKSTAAQPDNDNLDLTPAADSNENTGCITDSGESGECVNYYLCDPDTRKIIDDGTTIIDVRERSCNSYLDVCCLPKNTLKLVTAAKPLYDVELLQSADDKFYTIIPNLDAKTESDVSESTLQCGWNNPDIYFFPENDTLLYANFGEFPWAVALIKKTRKKAWSTNDYMGGGSIIHPSVVLTAAHKVINLAANKIKCRAGEWDTQSTKEQYPHQERDVNSILIHPHYYRPSLYNDVALLFLESPFELAPHIRTACVGKSLPPPETECFSMGWGQDFNNKYKYAIILKRIRVPLVGVKDCEEKLQKTRLGEYFKLHSSLTCAGGQLDKDTCQGDGGSALVCPVYTNSKRKQYEMYGMVAYGIDCGVPDRPGVYVNIPTMKDWIDQEMINANYGTETYTRNN